MSRKSLLCASPSSHFASTHLRWAGLLSLLIAELLFLSLRFDTGTLLRYDGAWAWLVGQSPVVLRFAIVAIAAIFLFSSEQLAATYHELSADLYRKHRLWPLSLAAHLVLLVLFTQVTQRVIESDLLASTSAGLGVLGWITVGIVSFACWADSLIPFNAWIKVARKLKGIVLVGCVIGAVAVLSSWVAIGLWEPLSDWTLQLVKMQLELILEESVYQEAYHVVGTPSFSVSIAGACSGYEGIGLIWVFFAAYIWLFRSQLRFPHVFLLFPLATLVIWFANSLRITTLILIGNWGWPEVALGGFHSQAGWLAFCGVGLGLVAIASRTPLFSAAGSALRPETTQPQRTNVAAPYLLPFLAILATAMITGSFTSGADALYPLRVLAVLACLWFFRRAYGAMRWLCSWEAVAIGALVAGIWLTLLPSSGSTEQVMGPAGLSGGWLTLWWASRLLGYAVTVPVAEELAFRGYLTRRLISAEFEKVHPGTFTWFSWLASSLLFGLMHGQLWLPGTAAGMLFGLAYYRRGNVGDAIVAHVTTNGLIAIYAASVGDWSLLS